MGVPGPCGPSSEIFYDKGPAYGADGGPVVDEERFVEIWNLVFMQHVQDEPYHVVGDLPAKNIDTGAGLERIAAVLQGVDSVFETDIVRPILATAESLTGAQFGASERTDVSLRIMADHGKSVTFLIGDKVVPSNEGRGYVLRRLLRRAVRHAYLLGSHDLVMPKLIDATIDVMGVAYPELVEKQAMHRRDGGARRGPVSPDVGVGPPDARPRAGGARLRATPSPERPPSSCTTRSAFHGNSPRRSSPSGASPSTSRSSSG